MSSLASICSLAHALLINPLPTGTLSLLTCSHPTIHPAWQAFVILTSDTPGGAQARILTVACSTYGETAAMRCLLEKMERDSTEILVGRNLGEDFGIGARMRGDGSSRGYTSSSGRYKSTSASGMGHLGMTENERRPSNARGEWRNSPAPFGVLGNERGDSMRDNVHRNASAPFEPYAEHTPRQTEDSQGAARPMGPAANSREESRGALYYSTYQRRHVHDAHAEPIYRPRTPRHLHIDPHTATYAEEQEADARRSSTAARNARLQGYGRGNPGVRETVASYDMFGMRMDRDMTPSQVHDRRPGTVRKFLRGDGRENNGIGGWS
jgi:hypothetical protein